MAERITRFALRCVIGALHLLLLIKPLVPSAAATAVLACSVIGGASAVAAENPRRSYDIARGDAAVTLKLFADASGRQVVYLVDTVRGVVTNPVKGTFIAREVLDRLLRDTALTVVEDDKSGALLVQRPPTPKAAAAAGYDSPSDPNKNTPARPMKKSLPARFYLSVALLMPTAAFSQTPAKTTGPGAVSEDAVLLSPFVISTAKDEGFVASTSLAGGRMAGYLKDTPGAYSVLTRDFIDALGLVDLNAASEWLTNSNTTYDDGRNDIFGSINRTTFRGIGATSPQRDFFPVDQPMDSYNLDRYDAARGPNAVLFGQGSLGGTANVVTKQAKLMRDFQEVAILFGSDDYYRGTVDVNKSIGDKTALRLNLLKQDRGGWQREQMDDRTGLHIGGTYEVFRNLTVRGEGEWSKIQRNNPLDSYMDRLSGWDGTTVFTAPAATAPANANALGVQITGNNTTSPVFLLTNNGQFYNAGGMFRTVGGQNSALTPIGGTVVRGAAAANYISQPVREIINGFPDQFKNAIAGSDFRVPQRDFSIAPRGPTWTNDFRYYAGFANLQIGDNLFIEAAGNVMTNQRTLEYITVRNLEFAFVDINQFLPNGQANPGFLKTYGEAPLYRRFQRNETYNVRTAAAYKIPYKRFGDYTLNFLGGIRWDEFNGWSRQNVVKRNADPRLWASADVIQNRYYWNTPDRTLVNNPPATINYDGVNYNTMQIMEPFTGGAVAKNPTELRYAQAAVSGKLFKGRLNLLGAFRRDKVNNESNSGAPIRNYPGDWNGNTVFFRPRAPADFTTLSFIPKDALGNPTGPATSAQTRPTTTVNGIPLAQPQYARDRFQDDYSAPTLEKAINTYSMGAVYHLTSWMSATANYATTFSPNSALDIRNTLLLPTDAKGYDAGLRFYLLDSKVVLSANYYKGTELGQSVNVGTGAGLPFAPPGVLNNIITANIIGDSTASGTNRRGVEQVPGNFNDTRDRKNKGVELELTANPTKAIRLSANIAFPQATQTNAFAKTRAYIDRNEPVFRQILADAGVNIDSGNVASPDLNVPAETRSPDANSASNSWNQLQTLKSSMASIETKVPRLTSYTANIFLDYTFREGWLKGLKVGGGANLRGKEVIGNLGANTVVDPADSTRSIDNPKVGVTDYVYRDPYHVFTATLGYTWKAYNKYSTTLQFRVDNLLDEDAPLYYSTVQRPINGDLGNTSRVATPSQYTYTNPRAYSLSLSVKF